MVNNIFTEYKDKHKGESAVLLGTGPTLDDFSFDVPDNSLYVGVNFIGNHKFFNQSNENYKLIDYYFFGDRNRHMDPLKDFDVNIQKFGAGIVNGKSIKEHLTCDEIIEMGALPYEVDNSQQSILHTDITSGPLYGHSVSFASLHFLLHTGVTTIYLVGQDCSGTKCFNDVPILNHNGGGGNTYDDWPKFWLRIKSDIQRNWNNVNIVSINPVGLKGMFVGEQ